MSNKKPSKTSKPSYTKTLAKNHETHMHRGVLAPSEEAVIEMVTRTGGATLKQMAAELFSGDFLKAKNVVRRPREAGLILFGKEPGSYVPGDLFKK